jgi:hypothetical protein
MSMILASSRVGKAIQASLLLPELKTEIKILLNVMVGHQGNTSAFAPKQGPRGTHWRDHRQGHLLERVRMPNPACSPYMQAYDAVFSGIFHSQREDGINPIPKQKRICLVRRSLNDAQKFMLSSWKRKFCCFKEHMMRHSQHTEKQSIVLVGNNLLIFQP